MVSAAAPSLIVSLLLLSRALPMVAHSVPLQAAPLEDMGGSGEAEDSSASSPSLPPPGTPALSPTSVGPQPTLLAGPKPPTNFLDGIVDFFRQYVMLIAVVGSLVFLLMFIVCAALITRQKHKASAYYPSSFPKKKYVDQNDRAGGPQAFSEVPDKDPDVVMRRVAWPQQLQAARAAASAFLQYGSKVWCWQAGSARAAGGKVVVVVERENTRWKAKGKRRQSAAGHKAFFRVAKARKRAFYDSRNTVFRFHAAA
ncbi:transmembrane protein 119 [Pteropus medius]|uniref:transmembrane protein 119 n=1 Tax=Pteropus vampyrus TaxID=132908 RepID=UPI00196A5B3F|nr:transmembrane protein 119 [Pteropus giganteus]